MFIICLFLPIFHKVTSPDNDAFLLQSVYYLRRTWYSFYFCGKIYSFSKIFQLQGAQVSFLFPAFTLSPIHTPWTFMSPALSLPLATRRATHRFTSHWCLLVTAWQNISEYLWHWTLIFPHPAFKHTPPIMFHKSIDDNSILPVA